MNEDKRPLNQDGQPRIAYATPKLTVFGDLSTITQAMSKAGADGATMVGNDRST